MFRIKICRVWQVSEILRWSSQHIVSFDAFLSKLIKNIWFKWEAMIVHLWSLCSGPGQESPWTSSQSSIDAIGKFENITLSLTHWIAYPKKRRILQLFGLKKYSLEVGGGWDQLWRNIALFLYRPCPCFPTINYSACLHLLLRACLDFCTKLPTTTKQACPDIGKHFETHSGEIFVFCLCLKMQSRRNVSCWSECEEPSLMKVSSLSSLRGISPSDAPTSPPSGSTLVSTGILRGSSPQYAGSFLST